MLHILSQVLDQDRVCCYQITIKSLKVARHRVTCTRCHYMLCPHRKQGRAFVDDLEKLSRWAFTEKDDGAEELRMKDTTFPQCTVTISQMRAVSAPKLIHTHPGQIPLSHTHRKYTSRKFKQIQVNFQAIVTKVC